MACSNTPCTISFKPAYCVCCDTKEVQCSELTAQANNIECKINKAVKRGDLYTYVNKDELNQTLIDSLRAGCYLVEFIPNPTKCGDKPADDANGVYKISWCICDCDASMSSSSCCSDLPGHCFSSSWDCSEIIPDNPNECNPCGCNDVPPISSSNTCC